MSEEHKRFSDTLDNDDEYNECILNPNNDRRVIICDSPNKCDGIIKCVGSIESQYIPDYKLKEPEKSHGTGTVIHIDKQNNIYILSAAHNIFAPEKRCQKCDTKTLKQKCPVEKCAGKTSRTGGLVKPTHIYFDRRGIVKGTLGECMQRYKIKKYEYRSEYETFCSAKSGYDICILICKCEDKNGINIYQTHCPKISLINDETFGGGKCVLHIFGYPGETRKQIDYRVYYYLFGMGTSEIDSTNKFEISKNKQTNKLFIINKGIDTTAGQSGSLIYGYGYGNDTSKYLVYGIHSGGSYTKRANYGTFFDIENIEWVANVMNLNNMLLESMSNKFIVCHYGSVISKMRKLQKDTDTQQKIVEDLKQQMHKLQTKIQTMQKQQDDLLDGTHGSGGNISISPTSGSTKPAPFEAYSNNGVVATFTFIAPTQGQGVCRVLAVFHNSNSYELSDFSFMIAVPKYIKLHFKPATGTKLLPLLQNSITQKFQLTNTMYGQKPFVIRMQVIYNANEQQVKDRSQVQFPDNCC